MMKLADIVREINNLDEMSQQRLLAYLQTSVGQSINAKDPIIKEIAKRKNEKGFVCPHCQSTNSVRFGKYTVKNGNKTVQKQRYNCKACSKTFTDLTNTPLFRTRKIDKWLKFVECMIEGHSLRKSSELIGGISWGTIFYWRHKVLSAMQQVPVETFQGIVEMDETHFLFSEQGKRNIKGRKPRKRGGKATKRGISKEQVCVLVARDRQKMTLSTVLELGRIVTKRLDKVISPSLSDDNVLCTDAWRAFSTFAKKKKLEHYRFNSKCPIRTLKGLYHIQNVNNYHSRLKKWMSRFNGVATKYLNHYLAWFRYLDMKSYEKTTSNLKDMLIRACLYLMDKTNRALRKMQFKNAMLAE